MRLVILESPYSAGNAEEYQRNVDYAKDALLDSLGRDESPAASHLLYTQVLCDDNPDQRWLGIRAGLAWGKVAEATVVYTDRGISRGMAEGIEHAIRHNRPVEYRSLQTWSPAK